MKTILKSVFRPIIATLILVFSIALILFAHKTTASQQQGPPPTLQTPTQPTGIATVTPSSVITLPPAQQLQFLNQPNRIELFDDSFPTADWSATQLPLSSSGGTFNAGNVPTGGYAGGFWSVTGGVSANSSLAVAHIMKGAVYNPPVEGSVLNLESKIRIKFSIQNNATFTYSVLLFQNGIYYAGPTNNLTGSNWTEIVAQELGATVFNKLYGTGANNPDFSCTGKEILVGFLVGVKNSTGIERKFNIGFDNYSIVFNSVCCSASIPGSSGQGCCGDEAAELDSKGNVILPGNVDTDTPPTFHDIDVTAGAVADLYPGYDTSVDTWYKDYPCDPSIGGSEPDYSPSLASDLASLGITESPDVIVNHIAAWESEFTNSLSRSFSVLGSIISSSSPLAGAYIPPQIPNTPRLGSKYVFGGRDIVFVHGLKLEHLQDEISNVPGAKVRWQKIADPAKPGNTANPEFYSEAPNSTGQVWDGSCNYPNAGYYWKTACRTWKAHIQKYFVDRGIKNRFIIVAYPNNQRLQTGAQAILKQIADAMQFGTGVFDLSNSKGRAKFGTPSYVVISHSTGGLATDVAMSTAMKFPNLGVKFVPEYCKAHLASQGAFSGSEMAAVPVSVSASKSISAQWANKMAEQCLIEFGSQLDLSVPSVRSIVMNSVLVDLVPLVTQVYWGDYLKNTPVKTLTLAGAHPSAMGVLKTLLHRGYDDGVLTINSQIANPNSMLAWPSGFTPKLPGLIKVFDMGIAFKLQQPIRAHGFGKDQVFDPKFNPMILATPRHVAGTATPYVSPTGMLQPVSDSKTGTQFDTLARYPNHYSFTLSASDHFTGTHDKMGELTSVFFSPTYQDAFSPAFQNTSAGACVEETRVITDKAVYLSYKTFKPYPGDDQPLVKISDVPRMVEIVRGRSIRFGIKFFKKRITKTKWIWKRRYHLLEGWESKKQFDYVYDAVLKN